MMDASASPQPSSDRPRISQLDGLRFFAFFAVFLNHFTTLPMLWTGVDVFFVISGFLITGNLMELRERTADRREFFTTFYWRRLLRIFPPYYLVLLVIMAFRAQSRPDLPYYVLFISNFRDSLHAAGDGPLGVFWSLAVEEQFYLLWPLVVWLTPPRKLARACYVAIAVALALRLGLSFVPDGKIAVYRMMPARFDLLAAGALLALASRRGALRARGDKPWFVVGAASFGTFVVLALTVPAFRAASNSALFNVVGFSLILGICVAVVALTINGTFRPLLYLLDLKPLRFIGTISYVCYLVHDFARYLLDVHAPGLHGTARMAVGFGATVAVGALSFFWIEDPLRRRFRDAIPAAKRTLEEPSPAAAGLNAGA